MGVPSLLCLGTRVSHLKSIALTVLELLAFNAQKFRGSRDRGHSLLGKLLGIMSGLSLGTGVKFEVRSFNRFGAIGI